MPPGEAEFGDAADVTQTGFHLTSPPVMLLLGLFLLCLVNSPRFRKALGGFFNAVYWLFRALLFDPIRWVVQSPLFQRILHSRLTTLLFRFVVKPLLWTAAAWWFLPAETNWWASVGVGTSVFLTFNLLLNSRVGRTVEEVVADGIAQGWRRFGLRLIVSLFWFFVDLFKRLLQTVEGLMYAVDEWLRFRAGQGRAALVAKAGLGLLWFFAAYFLRFAVNVLYEPQLNPIKHFPVVTVAHKILFPFYTPFALWLKPDNGDHRRLGRLLCT